MGTIRKTITFTQQQDDWIKAQTSMGQFTNDSEYIRALVRRDQERRQSIQAINAALIEGEESGVGKRTAEEIREDVRKSMLNDDEV